MKRNSNFTNKLLAALLTIAALATGQQAQAKTYIFHGENQSQAEILGYFYDADDPSKPYSSSWIIGTGSISFNLADDVTLTLTSSSNSIAFSNDLGLVAQGEVTLTISSSTSRYFYHVALCDGSGNIMMLDASGNPVKNGSNGITECDYWSMTSGNFSHDFTKGIAFQKIVISYATTSIPIADAVISGVADEYVVSNAAVAPTPTVTWGGTTLTKGTHYTVTYQNNTSAGTATVTATGKGIFSPNYSVSKNYTLRWANYTVRFDKNHSGASGSMSDQAFTYNTAQTLRPLAFTAPSGLQFLGWSTTPTGAATYTDGQSIKNLATTDGATVTLYAQWYNNWGIGDGADGSAEHPYIIIDKNGLDLLAKRVNEGNSYSGMHFQLGADIAYTHTTAWNNASSTENNYTAIGSYEHRFGGIFDGKGHTISGIRIYSSSKYQGIFGCVDEGGTVRNVNLADTRITAGDNIGGIAGYIYYAVVEDCTVAADVCIHNNNKTDLVGGIVGENTLSTVRRCISRATLIDKSGGLSELYGGIVGSNDRGTCQDCLAVGAHVAAVQRYNGAIAGYTSQSAIMRNNYYYDCTVGTATKNIGVTVSEDSNATTDTDGARGLYALALPDGIAAVRTATATLPGTGNATYADGADIAGNAYYVSGATVTISGAPSGTSGGISYATNYIVSYNDGEGHVDRYPADAQGNATFTMPAAAATVSCETTPSLDGRTLYKDDKWNTLCLPFNVTLADSPLAGCTLMALDGAQSDLTNGTLTLTFTEATSITAGTPYIIKWAAGDNIVAPVFTGVTIDQTMRNVATRDGKVTFKGTYDYLSFDAENKNILFLGGNDKLYYPQNGASIGACCAYFEVADGLSVKAFKLNIGGDETSIENVQWSMGRSASLYDLNGRKLQGKPSQKGIYIKDGKKVVVE